MIKPHKILLSLIVCSSFIISHIEAQTPKWEWAKRYDGNAIGNSILLDENNNLYVAGHFYSDLNIEDTTITSIKFTDLFIAKFDRTGNLIWIISAGGPINDNAASMTILDDFLYVVGSFDQQITFENFNLQTDLTGSIFLAKYDLNGNLIWVHYIGPGGSGACISYLNITNDTKKYLYMTGCMIHEQVKSDTFKSYNDNLFIAKYDTAGNQVWIKQYGGNSITGGRSIINKDCIYIYNTGCFKDTLVFGEVPSDQASLISRGNIDAYISKLDSTGKLIWIRQLGGELADVANSVVKDSINNIYITGSFYGTADFLDTTLISNGECDAYVLKLDSSGNRKWIKQVGSSGIDFGRFIYFNNNQQLYFIGNFQETISIADTFLISNSTYEYASNAYISKISSEGDFLWAKQIGSYWDRIESLIPLNNDIVYLTGSLESRTVYLDDIILPPNGPIDFFLAKINEKTSAIDELNNDISITLFPNPVNKILIIKIRSLTIDNIFLDIYSTTGILCYSKHLNINSYELSEEIDLGCLSSGFYFVVIRGNSINKTEKIIIF